MREAPERKQLPMISKLSLRSGLVRNVLTLFTGSTIAQASPVIISPILTRIFPVDDFATLTVVTTLISLLGVIVCGRYEIAVGLPADDQEARKLVYLAIAVALITSSVAMVFMFFFNHPIARLLNNEAAAPYLLLVPVSALVYGINQALTYWNIRKRNYALMSSSRVSQSLVNSGSSLAFGSSSFSFNGLVIGNILGQFTALAYTFTRTLQKSRITFSKSEISKPELQSLALKYSELPKVNGIHALTDMLQSTGVVLIISFLFGSITTGLYGLTLRILQAPLNLIGSSFSIVFYKEVSEKVSRNEKIDKLLRTTIRTLALISFPIFLTIMIFGPALFAFVFGEEWREAGVYARILSPWLFVNFISSPVSHLPVILNKQRQFFMLSLMGNSLVVLSLLAGSLIFKDVKTGLMLVAGTQVIFLTVVILYFLKIASRHGELKAKV